MRRRAKVDANQRAIVAAFRAMGWLVKVSSSAGDGLPDALICRPGRPETLRWIEIKSPLGPKGGASHASLTPLQQELQEQGWPVQVVRSVEDVERVR